MGCHCFMRRKQKEILVQPSLLTMLLPTKTINRHSNLIHYSLFFFLNAGSRLFFSAPKVTSRQNSLDKIRYKAQRTCYIHFSFSCCKLCPEEYHAILKDSTYQFLILMDERSTVTWKMVKKNYSWDMWYGSKDKTSPSS